ncbi:unnamed protein product, partial [Pylaiella littoralis]
MPQSVQGHPPICPCWKPSTTHPRHFLPARTDQIGAPNNHGTATRLETNVSRRTTKQPTHTHGTTSSPFGLPPGKASGDDEDGDAGADAGATGGGAVAPGLM